MVIVVGLAVGDLDHADGFVHTRAIDEFAEKVVIAIVFGDDMVAIMDVTSAIAIDLLFDALSMYIMFVGDLLPVIRVLVGAGT